ncbi:response regulator transcription factor [Novosphingobium sp. JCM 18896]|uniref:response regulator transcription factor n=1 Tax=Novosphingobium sp. JCM 18896 TaxID=2989731 RepID=UPI0022236858|nr:response regulator transcription factor [Novosphingobium sp. JCM 18896]MCW1427803.1 response regulator transcription factor [Novosphingobium sp. JCM 18896]
MAFGPRILLVDDHPLVRDALRKALEVEFPELILEDVGNIRSALKAIQFREPELVLLDYDLPDSGGFSGFIRIQNVLRTVPIAIISAYDQPRVIQASRSIRAAGFISKRTPLPEIVGLVRQLLAKERCFPEGHESESCDALAEKLFSLSRAQRQVLAALVRGDLNKQIASELEVAEATVKTHLTPIYRKLGVGGRHEAVMMMKPLLDPQIEGG